MGYAVAKAAMLRGAEVTLVSGQTALTPPMFVDYVQITTAEEMYQAVTSRSDEQDIIIKAAAVADYRPKTVYENKVKKQDGQMSIELEENQETFWPILENIKGKISFYVDFPWKRRI